MADRVLVIGLDMGDFALIEKWSVEGVLPTFRSLLAEGDVGRAENNRRRPAYIELAHYFYRDLAG